MDVKDVTKEALQVMVGCQSFAYDHTNPNEPFLGVSLENAVTKDFQWTIQAGLWRSCTGAGHGFVGGGVSAKLRGSNVSKRTILGDGLPGRQTNFDREGRIDGES